MSGFEIYTKKEKFSWNIACMDIAVTFVVVCMLFVALFSVFTMPYGSTCIFFLQGIALPVAIFIAWGNRYSWLRWGIALLAGAGSYIHLKINCFQGILPCVNSAIQLINKCYNINLTGFAEMAGYVADRISFLWVVCVLECLFDILILSVLKSGRGRFSVIVCTLLPVILGIFCGALPNVPTGCCLVAAIFLFVTASYQRERGILIRKLLQVFLLLGIVWLGARPIENSIYAYKGEHLKEYKEIKLKLIEARALDIDDWIPKSVQGMKDKVEELLPELGVAWNKNLNNLGKLVRTGKKLDEIVLEEKPTKEVYWAVFEGYVYTGKDWASKGSKDGVYEELTRINQLWPMKEYYDTEKLSAIIQEYYFDNKFRYTTNPKQIPEGMDFVEGFLFETKEGYCVHFATAATVFYQVSGKEARYVEGYMLMPSDFEQQADGTYKAIVTDYMAHAWCETYDAETGQWKVREHTLSSGLPTYRPTEPTEEPTKEPTKEPTQEPTQEPTKAPTKTPDGELTETPTQGPDDFASGDTGSGEDIMQGNGIEKNNILTAIWRVMKKVISYVLGVALTILVFGTLVIMQRKIRVKRRIYAFASKNIKKSILAIYREIQELCVFAGASDKELWKREHASLIAKQFPQLSAEEWEWVYDCVERTLFSNDLISTEEKKRMHQLYQCLRKGILEPLTVGKKIWFLYGKAL